MQISLRPISSKAIWTAFGIVLIALVMSIPCFCDSTTQDTQNATATIEAEREVYRANHLPWAVIEKPEIVGELIKNGEDVNAVDEDGVSALHWAVVYDHYNIAKMLLENGANVNVKEHSRQGCFNGWGWYPLHLALRTENKEMIRLLIDHGADVNAVRSDGWTPLFTAAYHGQPDVIELLISKGADVKVKNFEPLRLATDMNKIDGAMVLIKHGSDVNTIDRLGRNLLHVAANMGRMDVAKTLIQDKIQINLADNKGRTPLYNAVYNGYLDIVKLLIANGANVNVRTKDNVSLLEAVSDGKKNYLSSPNQQNTQVKRDWYGIRRVLLSHGAKA